MCQTHRCQAEQQYSSCLQTRDLLPSNCVWLLLGDLAKMVLENQAEHASVSMQATNCTHSIYRYSARRHMNSASIIGTARKKVGLGQSWLRLDLAPERSSRPVGRKCVGTCGHLPPLVRPSPPPPPPAPPWRSEHRSLPPVAGWLAASSVSSFAFVKGISCGVQQLRTY